MAGLALASACLVAAAALGSVFVNTARDAWTAIGAAGPAAPADGILLMTGLGGAFLSLWLGLGLTLSALSTVPGALGQLCARLADQVAPAAVRRIVALVLGTTLTAAFVPGNALAGNSHQGLRPPVVGAATQVMSGSADAAPDASFHFENDPPGSLQPRRADLRRADLRDVAPPAVWSLDKPASAPPQRPASSGSAARPANGPPRAASGPVQRPVPSPVPSPESSVRRHVLSPARAGRTVVVVHRGDTLWSIAARHLGPAATVADIDVEWRRWLVTNRDVIGDDANLILPGQLLIVPGSPRDGS